MTTSSGSRPSEDGLRSEALQAALADALNASEARLADCTHELGRAEQMLRLIADGRYGDASVKARSFLQDAIREYVRLVRAPRNGVELVLRDAIRAEQRRFDEAEQERDDAEAKAETAMVQRDLAMARLLDLQGVLREAREIILMLVPIADLDCSQARRVDSAGLLVDLALTTADSGGLQSLPDSAPVVSPEQQEGQ